MDSKKLQALLQPEQRIRQLLSRLDDAEAELLADMVSALTKQRDEFDVGDVWHPSEDGLSFWVLFLNGVDDPSEAELAKNLLFWREISSGPLACVRCIPSSERRLFGNCSQCFEFSSAPLLILSTDPQFKEYLRLDEGVLMELLAKGALQRFFTKLHTQIIRGSALEEINKSLKTERFWKTVKIVYSEVKDFVSLQITAG